ncbi:hypothetical protein Tco_1339532 [Tanacetum coccineum]
MALTAYADADYAGRSTSGSAQLLGDKLMRGLNCLIIALHIITSLYIVTTRVPLPSAATTSSTPGLNTSTSDIISLDNK